MSEMSVRLDEVLDRSGNELRGGFIACGSCGKSLVLPGIGCNFCGAISDGTTWRAPLTGMTDDEIGVAPFELPDPQVVPSTWAVMAIVAAGLFCAVCMAVGAGHVVWQVWHVLRLAIAWLVSA